MSNLSFEEMNEELDFDFFLDRESIPNKLTRGVSGMQFHIKSCPDPSCGDSRYRTYMGEESGKGNCFVCGRGFTRLSFIHAYLGEGAWRETALFVKELLKEQGWRPKRTVMTIVSDEEVDLPTSISLPTKEGSNLSYLEQRGFGGEIVKYFGFRYCEFGWWRYTDGDGDVQTQNFSNRVIIPVYDLDGKVKTFQGRDIIGTSTMKYLFPKELPGTGRYIYNGHNVVATQSVCMGEGALDVAAIKLALDTQPDLRSVCAIGSFGKHLSYGSETGDDQLGRINRLKHLGLKNVTIMWDGEKSALTSALSAARNITGLGLTARVALLPAGKDPNEVDPEVVVSAYREAKVWTPSLDIRWRLRGPYKS
jgi:DNA primase